MLSIVVISDTHGDFDTLYDIASRNRTADLFIHLGDGEREFDDLKSCFPEKAFLFVKGNNDWGNHPIVHTFSYGGHKLYLTHGHSFDHVSLHSFLSASAKANGCDIALFGHTHQPFNEIIEGVRLFNPGSPSRPRGMSKPSFGIIKINDDGKTLFEHKEYKF